MILVQTDQAEVVFVVELLVYLAYELLALFFLQEVVEVAVKDELNTPLL